MKSDTGNTSRIPHALRMFALAENTRKAYEKGWDCFLDYCKRAQISDPFSASPDAVTRFLISLATQRSPKSGRVLSMGTIRLYASAITRQFIAAGVAAPTHHPSVKGTLRGLAKRKGSAPRQVMALREDHIAAMLAECAQTRIGMRDAAILSLGFAAALRRSEICALRFSDIRIFVPKEHAAKRMIITVQRSKTDQLSEGQRIAVPEGRTIRPIGRLEAWLSESGVRRGPLFRSMRRGGRVLDKPLHHSDIPRLLKCYAAQIGLNPKRVSGHSLRAGFVTSAVAHQARMDKIMEVTRHRNVSSIMKYVRDADAFSDHAGEMFL